MSLESKGRTMKPLLTMGNVRKFIALATILVVGVLTAGTDRITCVEALTCSELYDAFDNANTNFSTAYESYFYNSPVTCAQECASKPPNEQAQCVLDCWQTRHDNLGSADLALFSAASSTCTPYTIDECAAARAAADNCLLQYPYWNYSNPEESSAVFDQYFACRSASKVDSCQ